MRYLLFSLLALVCSHIAAQNQVSIQALPPLEVSNGQGVAAPFAGVWHDQVWVAGGCNFPDTPAAEGGTKVYYNKVYSLREGKWSALPDTLPAPTAYGASVSTEWGIVCIGGASPSDAKAGSRVLLYSEGGFRTLPALPAEIQQAAAAYSDGRIYLVGGQAGEEGNHQVYRLALPDGKQWEQLATLPGKARLQPAAAIQSGATGPCLFVFGGYDPEDGRLATSVLRLDLKTLTWATLPCGPLAPTAGMCAVTSGYSHVLLMGGVHHDVFENALAGKYGEDYLRHPAQWYQFGRDILVYHTITDSWTTLQGDSLLARAGAALVNDGQGFVYINGESKPGIRSTAVSRITLSHQTAFGWLNWTVLAIYLLGMLGMGVFFMRRESGSDDFFRGGGRVPWWAAGISIYATMLSAITYMAIPAKAYATDWTYYPMLVTILLVTWPVIRYYLPYFRSLNITSAYEYLEMRFNAATRLMASGLFIIFMVARMALVLYLPSLALTAVTGIDINLCIVLMGIVTIIYCTMGGVEAVIWGDVVQGIILVGGAFFAAIYLACNTEGGVENYLQIAMDNDKFRLFEWSLDYRSATFWVAIIGGLANNLISYTSDQTVIQRYLTTKDVRSARNSILLNGVMCVFISVVFYFIGTGLYTFYKTHPDQLDMTMAKGDAVFPFFMMSQMPRGVAGLLIAAIFAATMSTISSNINSISTAFSIDFWKRFRPSTSDASMLRVARWTCVASGVIGVALALLMATWNILSLLDYFNTILGLLSSGLGGLFVMGIFFPRIKGKAALTGFVVGTAVVFWMQFCTDASLFLFGAVGMVVSVLVGYICSLIRSRA